MTTNVYIQRRGNGLAVAALVLGIIGVVFAVIPFTFVFGIILGLIGAGLGIPAVITAHRGGDRTVMAWFGLVLSVLALALSFMWIAVINEAVDGLERNMNRMEFQQDR